MTPTGAGPAGLLHELRRLGAADGPDAVAATYTLCAAAQREQPSGNVNIDRDLAYGPDPRHRLDVHHPPATRKPAPPGLAPVVLFVHGGGFVGGAKQLPGTPFFDNVGRWAARHGMAGVTMSYRLAPAARWPAGANDVARALGWVRAHATSFGGDPRHVVLVGHSAGAAHVASYLAGHAGPVDHDLAGAVMLSGIYDVPAAARAVQGGQVEQLRAYFGADPKRYRVQTALPDLADVQVPTLFGVAEFDLPLFHSQAMSVLDAKFTRSREVPPFVWVPGHNHFSQVLAMGVDEEGLSAALVRFVRQVSSPVMTSTAASLP